MHKFIPVVLSGLFATGAFAQATEAMKSGNPKDEAAAQANVDARSSTRSAAAHQPEANRSTNDLNKSQQGCIYIMA